MPTYQYRCSHCGHQFEEYQSITDDPLKVCPKCGEAPHRVITGGGGFLFKGTGFYKTDYRSKDYKSKADADKSSASSTSSTDSTPAKKSTDK
jgi:putative FmdB family regulatory protein